MTLALTGINNPSASIADGTDITTREHFFRSVLVQPQLCGIVFTQGFYANIALGCICGEQNQLFEQFWQTTMYNFLVEHRKVNNLGFKPDTHRGAGAREMTGVGCQMCSQAPRLQQVAPRPQSEHIDPRLCAHVWRAAMCAPLLRPVLHVASARAPTNYAPRWSSRHTRDHTDSTKEAAAHLQLPPGSL